jgi:hypothetical protein
MTDETDGRARLSIAEGFARSGLSRDGVWTEYLVMGGRRSYGQVVRALLGESRLIRAEHNKLAAALNEFFVGAGGGHLVGYIDLPTGDGP